MEMTPVEQVAASDPFGGHGVFLPMAATAQDILESLDRAFGVVSAVVWPMRGAWVDAAVGGMTRDAVLEAWEGCRDQSA